MFSDVSPVQVPKQTWVVLLPQLDTMYTEWYIPANHMFINDVNVLTASFCSRHIDKPLVY
jgi:hypothetical protein